MFRLLPDPPCANGHVFVWASNRSDAMTAEGIPCQCGATTLAYSQHDEHGNRKVIAVPVPQCSQ